MNSKVIAIDGTDASGKKTQTELLRIFLQKKGYSVTSLSFPDYEDESSTLVKMYLDGKFGKDAQDVNAYASSIFFAADRYASFVRKWRDIYLSGNSIILLDRYTTANAIHQLSKIEDKQEQITFLDWLYDLEFKKLGLPVPDLTLFLDVPPKLSLKLLEKRCEEKNIQKDIHEKNAEFLEKSYYAAIFAADSWGWRRIFCSKDNKILTKEEIHEKVCKEIQEIL